MSEHDIKRKAHEIQNEIELSIVVPLYNEAENLLELYERLVTMLDSYKNNSEIVFIDDGSNDHSFQILKNLHQNDSRVNVIRLRKNFGQSSAFSAGFDFARGKIIITIDADLQNDPAEIPKLIKKLEEGYDMVVGWRINRRDNYFTRVIPSSIANYLISYITGIRLHDYGCSLKAYRCEIIKNIKLYGEMHRFIPALASWMGVRICEIPVNHEPRKAGKSKYGLARITKVILDLITVKFLIDYATRPIHIFGSFGSVCLLTGIALGSYLFILKFFFGQPLSNRPIMFLVILLIIFGFQLITLGLLGELLIRTYYESQNKPVYMIKELLGLEPDKDDEKTETFTNKQSLRQ